MIKKFIFKGFIALFALFLLYYVLERLNSAFEKVWSLILPRLFADGVNVLSATGIFAVDSIIKFLLNIFVLLFVAFLAGVIMAAIKKIGLGASVKPRVINFFKKQMGIKEKNQVIRPALVDIFGSGVAWMPALVMKTETVIQTIVGNESFKLIHGYDTFPYHGIVRVFYLPIEQEKKRIKYLNVNIPEFMSANFSGGLQWPALDKKGLVKPITQPFPIT